MSTSTANGGLRNPSIPPAFKQAYKVIKAMMPGTLHRPVTPVGELLWRQHRQAMEDGLLHTFRQLAQDEMAAKVRAGQAGADDVENDEMQLALANAQGPVQQMLDETLHPRSPET